MFRDIWYSEKGNVFAPFDAPNWLASFGEEGMVLGGLWAMLAIRLFARLLAGVFRRTIA